jgi:hypothetical protein
MSDKRVVFETVRNQVTYLLARKDLTAGEREDIGAAIECLDCLFVTDRSADQPAAVLCGHEYYDGLCVHCEQPAPDQSAWHPLPHQPAANRPSWVKHCENCGTNWDSDRDTCPLCDRAADQQAACTKTDAGLVQQIPCPRCDGPLYHYPRDRRYTWPICGKCGYDTQLPAGLDQVPWTASDKSSGDVL